MKKYISLLRQLKCCENKDIISESLLRHLAILIGCFSLDDLKIVCKKSSNMHSEIIEKFETTNDNIKSISTIEMDNTILQLKGLTYNKSKFILIKNKSGSTCLAYNNKNF